MFDTYDDIQMKAGYPDLRVYTIGDEVSIPDGVYIDDSDYSCGAVVIKDGKLLWTTDDIWDHFGQRMSP